MSVVQPNPPSVSSIRSRDEALGLLVPQILGIIWDHGTMSVELPGEINVGAYCVSFRAFGIHVYVETTKMFSAHIACKSVIDDRVRHEWAYQGGQCAILSWKRGIWEDLVIMETVEPRSIQDAVRHGLVTA